MPIFHKNLALYVDYENLRQTMIRGYGMNPDPTHIGTTIRKAAQEEGKLVVQNVYGDWKFLHTAPDGNRKIEAKPALTKAGLNPVDVPVKGSGPDTQDRTDIWLAIDAAFDVFTVKNVKKVMIASSDGDYCPLVRKIQGQNKDVVVCGFSISMGPELQAIANKIVFLDHLLNLTPPPAGGLAGLVSYNWTEFIDAMIKAESLSWAFVGLKRFRDSWMNVSMGASEPSEKHEMINFAIREQIILKHMVTQPGSPHETTAIKLNREHPLVREYFDRK